MAGTVRPSKPTGSEHASNSAFRAPPGYKLIKVRKADGTIITVKKKLSPGEYTDQHKDKPDETTNSGIEYKIVTVRMPNGSLAKVKRPIKPGTDAESQDTTPHGQHPTTVKCEVTVESETNEQVGNLKGQDINRKRQRRARFKTTLVHGLVGAATAYLPDLVDGDELVSDSEISDDDEDVSDGDRDGEVSEGNDNRAMVVTAATSTVAAAAAGAVAGTRQQEQTPNPVGVNQSALNTKGKSGDEKSAYKITAKELKELDEKAARQEADAPLERRWAEFSFYLMASLSIILPLLFLVLTAFIMAMDGKSTSSNWGKMIDPIKISVTVWPIVFAAVTAQGFKTWATFKVERGIKLMELEQLVGSNSFGSVMKQPFFLRRLDFLTLLIFAIWALSPIGSQALIRAYTLERGLVSDRVPVLYVPLLGDNRLLSPGVETRISDATDLSEYWQAVCGYYIGAFLPDVRFESDPASDQQDLYNHPFPRKLNTSHPDMSGILSGYGLPVALAPAVVQVSSGQANEDKVAAGALRPFENITFPITSSYFNLTCGEWATAKRSAINESMEFSSSETLGLSFSAPASTNLNNTTMDRVQFATLLDGGSLLNRTDPTDLITPDAEWEYALIDCGFEQISYNSTVTCWIDARLGSSSFSCSMEYLTIIPDSQVSPEWHTPLADFSLEFARGGSPYPILYPYTPIELWSLATQNIDGFNIKLDPLKLDPNVFAANFGTLFNTFVTVAHCPECISVMRISSVNPDLVSEPDNDFRVTQETAALYMVPDTGDGRAHRIYSPPGLVFSLDWRWVWTLLACVVILLIVGVASVALESILVAPDVLGYASTLARNSRYLHLPKTAARPMGGIERVRIIGGVSVMMQDVKPNQGVGKIALGLKHDRAERLRPGRLYR